MIGETSFFIDLMRSDPGAVDTVLRAQENGNIVGLTTVTVFELRIGISMGERREDEKAEMYSVLEGLTVFPFDQAASIEAGRIYAIKTRDGVKMDVEDAMIAGIARVRKQELLTRYTKIFSGIDGLKIHRY